MLISNVATIALGICLTGLLWRISRWFLNDIGPAADALSTGRRLAAAGRAFLGALFSPRLFRLIGGIFSVRIGCAGPCILP